MAAGLSARPTSWTTTWSSTRTCPVSTSTSTSARCAANAGARAMVAVELLPRVAGGLLDAGTHGVGDLAAAARARVRRGFRIGVDHADQPRVEAEALGGDLGKRGIGPAHVDRAHDDGERAVALEPADGVGGLDAAHPAAEGDADSALESRMTRRRRRAAVTLFLELLEAGAQPDARPLVAVGHQVALARGVPQSEVERIETERAGHVVHLGLQREGRLDGARGAVGAVAGLVR